MSDIQCEHCGWIGDEGLYRSIPLQGTADLECPACHQAIEGLEVDWKERCSLAENELTDVRRDLAATVDRVIVANERAKAAEAEIAGWRRAVRWETVNTENHYHLKVGGVIVGVVLFVDRWSAMAMGTHYLELGSRDAACAKLCEVLGIPVVLPTAPARQ